VRDAPVRRPQDFFSSPLQMKFPAALLLSVLMSCTVGIGATVSAPSTLWSALQGNFDFADDQPSGQADTNIVGLGTDYGLFVTQNDNGPLSLTDGTFGFRLRLDAPGGNKNSTKYEKAAYLGIDADFNDTIDVFIGLNFFRLQATTGDLCSGHWGEQHTWQHIGWESGDFLHGEFIKLQL
jgi:hypothetical protein